MNSEFINDLLECSVCLKPLDEQNKVLPCQHTFCKLCLQTIVKSHKELRCPECRVLVKQKVEDLPANILLIRLLDGIKYQQNNKPQATEKPDFRRHSVEGILSSPVPASGGAKDGGSEANLVDLERRPIHERAISEPYSASSLQVSTATRPHAKALFDYESHIPSDLVFKKGDMVALTKRVDDNWFSGECHGRKGVFPANYVEVIQPLASDGPYCYALYDFESSDAEKDRDCLTFSKNEKIIVIRKVDENWVEGMLREKIGIFPLSFVKLSDDARKMFDTLSISDAGAKSPGSKGDADVREKGTMGAAARKIVSNKPGYKSSKKRHSFPTFHAAKASGENLPSSPYRHSMELSASVSGPPPSDSFHLHGTQDQVNPSNQDAINGRKSRNQIVAKSDGQPSIVNNVVATAVVKMPMRVS
uniref:Uncharacterized protein n=1 Tax=Ciona savignyi TaxID=51511 RepID=H2ZCX8_CIOSA